MKHPYLSIIALFLSALVHPLHAQEQSTSSMEDLMSLSLEELMNIEIVSASKKSESNFDSPLSSSVVTQE